MVYSRVKILSTNRYVAVMMNISMFDIPAHVPVAIPRQLENKNKYKFLNVFIILSNQF